MIVNDNLINRPISMTRTRQWTAAQWKAQMPCHPLFGVQPMGGPTAMGLAFSMTVNQNYKPAPPAILGGDTIPPYKIELRSFVADIKENSYPTLTDLEDAFFEMLMGHMEFPPTRVYDPENRNAIAVILNRARVLIATRTRRGAGNVIIAGDNTIKLLCQSDHNLITYPMPQAVSFLGSNLEPVGTFLNNIATIYRHKRWHPDHPAVICYKGASEVDAGAFLMVHELESGEMTYVLHVAESEDRLSPWHHYYSAAAIVPR